MQSSLTPLPGRYTPAPHLLPKEWWKKNIVVVLVILAGIAVLAVFGVIFSARLLAFLPKQAAPTPTADTPTPVPDVVPKSEEPKKTIGEVIVPAWTGEDNFSLRPVDFDEMGMGAHTEIVIRSRTDMDTDTVLFHLLRMPAFEYDIITASAREIRIKPKTPLPTGAPYRFSLDTQYDKDGVMVHRVYHWAYEVKEPPALFDRPSMTVAQQEQMAQEWFGLYKAKSGYETSAPPLNTDVYHGVVQLTVGEPVPFETLPPSALMDVYIVAEDVAPLWRRLLEYTQIYTDVYGLVSNHIVWSFFQQQRAEDLPAVSESLQREANVRQQESVLYHGDGFSITELLALIAYADEQWLPRDRLQKFFESIYFSSFATSSERAQAAFGLASLGRPYIQEQVNLLNDPTLTPIDRLYLGLGLERLGAGEYTRIVYQDTIKDYKVIDETRIRIQTPEPPERARYATVLTALAGLAVDREDIDIRRFMDTDAMDTFLDVLYRTKRIERAHIAPRSFDIVFGGKTEQVRLDDSRKVWSARGNAAALQAMRVSGERAALRILIVSVY